MNTEPQMTMREVAEYCGVSYSRIRAAAHAHELEFYDFAKPGAKKSKWRRFPKSSVDRWLHSLRSEKGVGL